MQWNLLCSCFIWQWMWLSEKLESPSSEPWWVWTVGINKRYELCAILEKTFQRLVLKVLEDDARPAKLRSCNPWGETKFSLQMRKGGLVSQGENILLPSVVNYLWLIHSGACLWQCSCWRAQLQSHPHLWGNYRRRCHKVHPTFLYFSKSCFPNKKSQLGWPALCLCPSWSSDTQMGNIDQTFTHAPHDARLAQ